MSSIRPTERKIDDWQELLWRERRYCGDSDYAKQLRRLPLDLPEGWILDIAFRRSARPYAADVEAALRTACQASGGVRHLWQGRLDRLDKAKRVRSRLRQLVSRLEDHHWFERFLARHLLLYRGGDAVATLLIFALSDSEELQRTALWLLESIGHETRARLADEADQLLCTRCVVHCHSHEIELPGRENIVYYGCRDCRNSQDFKRWPGGIVAVLDQRMVQDKVEAGDQIRVNWLQHQRLFDFDRVEILRATDEMVERFAVQVGNDTDLWRKERYSGMPCTLSRDCRLSANAVRVLEHVFGRVEVADQGGDESRTGVGR